MDATSQLTAQQAGKEILADELFAMMSTAQVNGDTSIDFPFYVGANSNPQTRPTLVPGETYYVCISNVDATSSMRANFTCKG